MNSRTLSDWVDVSYTKLSGKWVKNLKTGEVRELPPDLTVPETVEPAPVEDLLTKKFPPAPARKKFPPKTTGWKNNAA
jgi:hypothetical protein